MPLMMRNSIGQSTIPCPTAQWPGARAVLDGPAISVSGRQILLGTPRTS